MRRAPAEVKKLEPDPVYRSVLVTQVINKVLWRGKKGASRRIVYGALEIVDNRTGGDPLATLKKAIDNIRPQLEVRSRRVGGSSYQVPVEVRPRRAQTLAVRWLVEFARKRREPTMAERLANEILDAANRGGAAVKRREDIHKMAESNKAFAHYRW
jgi:small subunit ribosomal protein S7